MIEAFSKNLVGEEIYENTEPKEYGNFQAFLKRDLNPKYDVVIDGLNVGFSGTKKSDWNKNSGFWKGHDQLILNAVEQLKEKGFKHILLIHRHWFQRSKDYLKIKDLCSNHFLLDRTSTDDPFSIIAALHFGPGTYILSNDLFRHWITL